MGYLSVEHLVAMVNATVESFTNITAIMRVNPLIDEVLYNSISDILYFLDKVSTKLPDVLIASDKRNPKKRDVQVALGLTIIAWDEFFDNKENFFKEWDSFTCTWAKFELSLKDLNSSKNSIFLSLN